MVLIPSPDATETKVLLPIPGRDEIGTTVISSECGSTFILVVPIAVMLVSIAEEGFDLVPIVRSIPSGGNKKSEGSGIGRS